MNAKSLLIAIGMLMQIAHVGFGATNLFINEWLAHNVTTSTNSETGQPDSWVELYNAGTTPINIGGYYLSSTLTNIHQFRIPASTTIAAGQFLLFWANGQPGEGGDGGFHLYRSGGFIGLYSHDSNVVDEVFYGPQLTDISQGRWPDGSDHAYFLSSPTAVFRNDLLLCPNFSLVNVIPTTESNETDQNSEASISVFPVPLVCQSLVISAFRRSPVGPHPYYESSNGGSSWGSLQNFSHRDTTLEWGNDAYVAYLYQNAAGKGAIDVGRSASPDSGTPFTSISGAEYATPDPLCRNCRIPDQPWLEVVNVNGTDQIYVGFNDLSQSAGKSASVHVSLDAGATWNNFPGLQSQTPVVIERVTPSLGQDGPPIRVSAANDGKTVYAAFERLNGNGADLTGDVVVVRDNFGGLGGIDALPFSALGLGANNLPQAGQGTLVAQGVLLPNSTMLGSQQRLGSSLSLVVDRRRANRVYVAFVVVESVQGIARPRLQVFSSTDFGQHFTMGFSPSAPAALPALAVAANGTVGLLYTVATNGNLETHLFQAQGGDFTGTTSDVVLSQFPDGTTTITINPYVGDYQDLEAVGNEFFGTFCASNDPDRTHFPAGVFYQRYVRAPAGTGSIKANAPLTATGELVADSSGTRSILASIDPFFFRAQALRPPISVVWTSYQTFIDPHRIPNNPCPYTNILLCLQGYLFKMQWPILPFQIGQYGLESTLSLSNAAVWSPVSGTAVEDLDGNFNVTVLASDAERFFRLQLIPATNAVYTVDAGAGAHGSVSPTGIFTNNLVPNLFTATPDPAYEVDRWYLDGAVEQLGGTNYTLPNDRHDHVLTVGFLPRVDLSVVSWFRPIPLPEEYPVPFAATVGSNLICTVTVANSGVLTLTNITMTNTLPSEVTFVGVASSMGSCARNGNTVTCNFESLGGSESAIVEITMIPTSEGILTNTTTVHATGIMETNQSNNTVTVTIPVVGSE